MNLLWAYIISFLTGFILIDLVLGKKYKLDFYTHAFLAGGIGPGISAHLLFYNYLFFNQLNRSFSIALNLVLLAALIAAKVLSSRKEKTPLLTCSGIGSKNSLLILALAVLSVPAWLESTAFPYGGWDAWSVWNLKSKFLFLGGEHWQNMLKPQMWRSSPHYPLLLPLINVWGWIFSGHADPLVPRLTGFLFTFLTAGLLFTGLKNLTGRCFGIFASGLILTLLFYLKLAGSQYADIVVSYFMLGALFFLIRARLEGTGPYAFLAGICLGMLSFTKIEGAVAGLIIVLLACPYLLFKDPKKFSKSLLLYFFSGLFAGCLPTILFQIFYSPGNQTFINGLASAENPVTFNRLTVIFAALPLEIISSKWNGIWVLLLLGLLAGKKKCFDPAVRIIPAFLAIYLLSVLAFYFINTRWEIIWFITSTLNRVVFSLLPVCLLWIFYSLEGDKTVGD